MSNFKERLFKELHKEFVKLLIDFIFLIIIAIFLAISLPILVHTITSIFNNTLINEGIIKK